MGSIVVGTAGHIDHGKSALVKALTGTDPDRLKEEQTRGITIDLGFAHLAVGDLRIAFVDVPGHERFVRNMLAGAGGIDAVLLVVAADEGVKPQTREHFEICRLLGIDRGLVVLSKADLVDAERLALVTLEIRDLVAGSFLASAPIVPASTRTGAGLDAVRGALAALGNRPPRQARRGLVRYPVDRAFTVKGFGTVVTGTLVSGHVAEGDDLVALPGARAVRVRGVQIHGRTVSAADAPCRAAINTGAVGTQELGRGLTLASAGSLAVTRRVDVRLAHVPGALLLRHGARVRVHQGTAEVAGRVALCAVRGADKGPWHLAGPGEVSVSVPQAGEGYARLRLEQPLVLTRGDRLVLRTFSPPATVGGAVVLDPEPPPGRLRRQAAFERFDELSASETFARIWLAEAGPRGLGAIDLVRRGGLDEVTAAAWLSSAAAGPAVAAAGRYFDAAYVEGIGARVVAELAGFHQAQPGQDGMPREALRARAARGAPPALFDAVLAGLGTGGRIRGTDRLALASHRSVVEAGDARAMQGVVDGLRQAGLTPPDLAALAASVGVPAASLPPLLQRLVRERRVVRLGTLVFHPDALAALKADVQAMRRAGVTDLDVAAFKARYGLSRKFAIPLLEWLDRERVTRRVGELRRIL
jgi:selenocysteine-specific elongation factor